MRHVWILPLLLLVVGCATQRPVAVQPPPPVVIAAASPTKFVETRYDVRGYREAGNPAIRHEAHAVYRRTRVPLAASDDLETVPLTTYAPASHAPLSASDELAAELATQRAILTDLRSMQASMAETERQMQAQYAQLVRQSAEILKLREQLEAERSLVRSAAEVPVPVEPAAAPAGNPVEVKW